MRNLKKILALVLALMMVLSVMVTASAVDFTDADEIDHTEAVNVMAAAGVLNGIPAADGTFSFNPDGYMSREGVAKMIAFITTGDYDYVESIAAAMTTDLTDISDSWAKDYIVYCANLGFINGYNGKFDPAGNITGYGLGKLLLCAAGIGTGDDYTGADWEVKVLVALKNNNLTKGLEDITWSKDISRDDACQLAFNVMKHGVTTLKHAVTYGGDAYYFATQSDATVFMLSCNIGAPGSAVYVGLVPVTSGSLLELVHGVTSTTALRDANGRPGTTYLCNAWDESVFVANAPVLTYSDTSFTRGALYSALTPAKATGLVTLNGVNEDGTANAYSISATKNSTSRYYYYGATVEFYATATVGTYDVVVVYDHYAEVDSLPYAYAAADYATAVKIDVPELGINDYVLVTDGYTYGDDLIVRVGKDGLGNYKVTHHGKAAVVTGIPSFRTDSYVVIDGVTYYYSNVAQNVTTTAQVTGKNTLNYYVDTYGEIVEIEAVTSAYNYAVVLDTGVETPVLGASKNYAQLLFNDGTTDVVQYYCAAGTPADYTLMTYTVNPKTGVYTLQAGGTEGNAAITVTPNNPAVGGTKATANTLFVVEHVKNGVKTYATYTGIANVPYVNVTDYAYLANPLQAGYAAVVYLYGATPAVTTSNVSDLIFIAESTQELYVDADRGEYYNYMAVVGGEIVTIDVNKADAPNCDALYGNVVLNSNGLATTFTPATFTGIYAGIDGHGVDVENGYVIEIGGTSYVYTDETVVYYEYYNITEMDVATLDAKYGNYLSGMDAIGYTTNGVVTELYVFYK